MKYDLYVDGSPGPKKASDKCPNPSAGWGLVLLQDDLPVITACGRFQGLTTNAVELEAMIQGLAVLLRHPELPHTTIWTDSQYVATSLCNLPRLKLTQFDDGQGNPVVNAERLSILHDMMYVLGAHRRCVIRKVKGHEGIKGNEIADVLSKDAAYSAVSMMRDQLNPIYNHERENS